MAALASAVAPALVLGVESSCDETAAAVVRGGRDVLSNVIASQYDLHEEYGGVVPEIASRAHVERILPVVRAALREAGVGMGMIGAVAVGNRPGLVGSLLVGVSAAKALAWTLGVPLVGVDHIHAHLYAGFLRREGESRAGGPEASGQPELASAFPALGLVVSGGHTVMFRCDSPTSLTRLGGTIDDAVGEAYDKVAALLGLGHPGGPRLEALASRGDARKHQFPSSRLGPESLDLSFSGLKTSVLYRVKGFPGQEPRPPAPSEQDKADVAASFQKAAVGAVIMKMTRAIEQWRAGGGPAPRSILAGGGVTANKHLRQELASLADRAGLPLVLPHFSFCTDNAAMIAGLGHARLAAGDRDGLELAAWPASA